MEVFKRTLHSEQMRKVKEVFLMVRAPWAEHVENVKGRRIALLLKEEEETLLRNQQKRTDVASMMLKRVTHRFVVDSVKGWIRAWRNHQQVDVCYKTGEDYAAAIYRNDLVKVQSALSAAEVKTRAKSQAAAVKLLRAIWWRLVAHTIGGCLVAWKMQERKDLVTVQSELVEALAPTMSTTVSIPVSISVSITVSATVSMT